MSACGLAISEFVVQRGDLLLQLKQVEGGGDDL
jgi:hypothetical protein